MYNRFVANLNKKIYELSDDDLVKLKTIRESEECASDVAALRICIRETYKSRCERAAQSLSSNQPVVAYAVDGVDYVRAAQGNRK